MSIQAQHEFLMAQAAHAEAKVLEVKDPQAKVSWQRIAESCRHLARQYHSINDGVPVAEIRSDAIPLVCPECLSLGAAVWGEQADGKMRLISLHGNFHSETGRTAPGETVIVCTACDTIQD